MNNIFKHLSNMIWKITYERKWRIKRQGKKTEIYDDQILENIKKYYNIEDHEDY